MHTVYSVLLKCTNHKPVLASVLSCVSAGMSVVLVHVYKLNQLWRTKATSVCVCIFVFVQQSYSLVIFAKDAASCLFGFLEEE